MSRTFYGVLGVGPDADEEAIRAAYRERVKEHHPDVSSDPDAADRFKRLTAAKETLLDAADRARYDRLGHRAYVDSHADSTLWASDRSPEPTASQSRGSTPGANGTRDATTGSRGAAADRSRTRDATDGSSRSGSTGTWAGRTGTSRRSSSGRSRRRTGERTRSDGARRSRSSRSSSAAASSTGDDGDGSTEETVSDRSRGSGVDPGSSSSVGSGGGETSNVEDTASNGGGRSAGEEPSSGDEERDGDDTQTAGSDATASRTATDRNASGRTEARTAEAGAASETAGRRRRRANGGTATDRTGRTQRSSTGSYATTSFWGVAADSPSVGRSSNPVTRRAFAVCRRLGPWILVHALFLSLAVGTGWYVYAVVLAPAERSVALLFVLIGEVGLAVVLSSLHILSRLYR
ncbi:J domain-containing protein [Halosimplex litoreum]|uniref:J domain-containing protein n=1 Tax=Halosimplex litoreum TaxID=1198301 RepID=A0A7T3KV71_9EURY|nr:DnaJ domain-containing protein [Halosimplex litoreum]QPV63014.1 J domain-containing protein [Halosimplex litoreum]